METIIEKSVIKTEVVFSADKTQRYLLRKEWDGKNKKKAMVIMISPSISDEIVIDHTTMFVINNLSKLEYGSVDIVNIFTDVRGSRAVRDISLDDERQNERYIKEAAEKADTIIIAWGSIGENNQSVKKRQDVLLQHINSFADKLYQIADSKGRFGFHPLSPQVRSEWTLVKYNLQISKDAVSVDKSKKQSEVAAELINEEGK